jgi:predicted Zn-dependent peptidase
MSVSIPLFDFGFKEIMETPERSLKEVIVKRIILEVLASKTSPLYKELLEEGLINDEFEAEYFTGTGYGMTIFSGESNEPKKVTEKIKEAIKKLKESKITEEDFERARKRLYGEAVMSFNNISGIANGLLVSHFKGDDLFSEFNILAGLMLEDINNALKDTFNENAQCLSVVIPK